MCPACRSNPFPPQHEGTSRSRLAPSGLWLACVQILAADPAVLPSAGHRRPSRLTGTAHRHGDAPRHDRDDPSIGVSCRAAVHRRGGHPGRARRSRGSGAGMDIEILPADPAILATADDWIPPILRLPAQRQAGSSTHGHDDPARGACTRAAIDSRRRHTCLTGRNGSRRRRCRIEIGPADPAVLSEADDRHPTAGLRSTHRQDGAPVHDTQRTERGAATSTTIDIRRSDDHGDA